MPSKPPRALQPPIDPFSAAALHSRPCDIRRRRLLAGLPALAGTLALPALPAFAQTFTTARWSAAWGCAPAGPPPVASTQTFTNQTLRLIVRSSLAGNRVRIRISNEMGSSDLVIGRAAIGLRQAGATVVAASQRALTFGGRTSITIPAGAPVLSDPVTLAVPQFADLAVSLYLPTASAATTIHNAAYQANYISTAGDHALSTSLPTSRSVASWPFLTEVAIESNAPVLVVAGDSVTDGVGSSSGLNRRWTDWLALRAQAELGPSRLGVVNRGISANRLLADTPTALLAGNDVLERFDRDVVATSGVRALAVLIGINDIVYSAPSSPIPVDTLAAGFAQLVERAHARGIAVLGATLPPFNGFVYYTPAREAVRQGINAWMRSAAPFDLLADLDVALRNPSSPGTLRPAYDSGDHLHPNDTGYQALAAAIPLGALASLIGA